MNQKIFSMVDSIPLHGMLDNSCRIGPSVNPPSDTYRLLVRLLTRLGLPVVKDRLLICYQRVSSVSIAAAVTSMLYPIRITSA